MELQRQKRLAWATLGFVLFVILFGAVVRITGSGAGCGQHWPTCNGDVAHLPKTTKTLIELTHRLTSGASMLLVIALVMLGRRRLEQAHLARKMAGLALFFMIVEALIGAVLVRRGLVENNASVQRAVVMSLHLVNTSALTAALALTAWACDAASPRLHRPRTLDAWLLVGLMAGLLVVATTGAVTALGDTVYPVVGGSALHGSAASDLIGGGHFLRQLRIVHPILAATLGLFLLYLPARIRDSSASPAARSWAQKVFILTLAQLGAGVANIWLSAPGFMQVTHLALASGLWICLVLTFAALVCEPAKEQAHFRHQIETRA